MLNGPLPPCHCLRFLGWTAQSLLAGRFCLPIPLVLVIAFDFLDCEKGLCGYIAAGWVNPFFVRSRTDICPYPLPTRRLASIQIPTYAHHLTGTHITPLYTLALHHYYLLH